VQNVLGKGDVVCDLGCGDGRVLQACLASGKAEFALGVELQAAPLARARVNLEQQHNCELVQGDMLNETLLAHVLAKTSLVFLFLLPNLLADLLPLLEAHLVQPNARVVSYLFSFPPSCRLPPNKLILDQHLIIPNLAEAASHLYVYRKQ
jgi:hypothetical protein